VYKHWDGVLYVVVAKTFYNIQSPLLQDSLLAIPLSPQYFAAHLPLYPFLIWLGSVVIGYLKSMVLWPVIFACLYGGAVYNFSKKLKLTDHPLILAIVALFVTPRFFIVRSVGAPETIFLFFVVMSLYFFLQEKYWYAGFMGALAFLTKSPGILLFIGYSMYFAEELIKTRKIKLSWLGISLIPLAFVGLCTLYAVQMNDFLAYFHSGDNIHLLFPPFQVFNSKANWVGSARLEEILFIFVFYILALITVWGNRRLRPVFYTMLVFFLAIISVQHIDIARYSLPLLPFALVIFEKFFTSRKFLIALVVLLPAVYMYAWNFMLYNQAPITLWGPLM
jgi:hypothetical protein